MDFLLEFGFKSSQICPKILEKDIYKRNRKTHDRTIKISPKKLSDLHYRVLKIAVSIDRIASKKYKLIQVSNSVKWD